jgi:hypothetical protein
MQRSALFCVTPHRARSSLLIDGDTAILLNAADMKVALCTHLGEMKLLGA